MTNVTSLDADKPYKSGEVLEIDVTFTGPVSVVGTPQLRLGSGANAFALFDPAATGLLPSNTLKFKYVVGGGDNAADLDYAAPTSLELGSSPGGIVDQFGVPARLTLPVPGSIGSLGWNKNIVVDTTAPYATITLSKQAVGNVNNMATVTFTLSEPATDFTLNDIEVTSNGVSMRVPGADVLSNFTGSGRSYSADFTPPSGFVGTVLFTVAAGQFTDAASNGNVILAGSPAQLWVDTNAPVVRQVTSSTANGTLKAVGDTVDVHVEFSLPVAVGGLGVNAFPYLELNSGTGARAEFISVVGSQVNFRYTVGPGEEALDLDYRSVDALKGGYILRLDTGTPALRTLPVPGSAGSLAANKNLNVDTLGPSVTITASRYLLGAGQTALLTFSLSESADPVNPFTESDVTISNSLAGSFLDANGVTTWHQVNARTFTAIFTPAAQYTGQVTFAVDAKTFKDVAGNDNTASTIGNPIVVNTASPLAPTVTTLTTNKQSPTITGTTGTNPLLPGQRLIVEINGVYYDSTSGASGVKVTGNTWSLNLATASPVVGTWSPLLDGDYDVVVKVVDTAGNESTDTSTDELTIDTVAPAVVAVTSISPASPPAYGIGKLIQIDVTFSEPVFVTGGVPTLLLDVNTGTGATAMYDSLNSTPSVLRFVYKVNAGESANPLDYAGTGALKLNGATIRDAATNDANRTLATPGTSGSLASAAIQVETTAPTATIASSTPKLKIGEKAVITITFNEDVTHIGPASTDDLTVSGGALGPTITGGPKVFTVDFTPTASFVGSGTIALVPSQWLDSAGNPAVAASLTVPIDIDTVPPSTPTVNALITKNTKPTLTGTVTPALGVGETLKVTVNGSTFTVVPVGTTWSLDLATVTPDTGTFTALVGSPATTYLVAARTSDAAGNELLATAPLTIDTVTPTVLNVQAVTADGEYGVGKTITIAVTFDEVVDLDPAKAQTPGPRLRLDVGSPAGFANYESGTGTTTWLFDYKVAAGQATSDLDYVSITSLQLNGSGLIDAAGNEANRTLAAPGVVGSLGDNSNIVVETTAPLASIVSSLGTIKKGQTATITVTFTEPPVTPPTLTVTPSAAGAIDSLQPTGDQKIFTAIFTPALNYENIGGGAGSVGIGIAAGSYQDAAGNLGLAAALAPQLQVDTKSPTVTISKDRTSLITGQTLTVTYTWSEPVTFDSSKVLLQNLSPQSFNPTSGSAGTFTAVYAPAATYEGQAIITVPAGAATDAVGNPSDAGTPVTIDVDTKSPTVQIIPAPIVLAAGMMSTVEFKFSSDPGTSFDLGDVTVSPAGAGTWDWIGGSGTTRTATFTPSTQGAVTITVAPGSFTDTLGNANVTPANATITVDTVAPFVESVTAVPTSGIYKAGDTVVIRVKFSEPTNGNKSLLALALDSGADAYAYWAATDGDGMTEVFHYKVASGENASRLNYDLVTSLPGTGLADTVGNPAVLTLPIPGTPGSLGITSSVIVDTTAPTVLGVKALRDGSFRAGGLVRLDVTFSENVSVVPGSPAPTLELSTGGIATLATGAGVGSLPPNVRRFVYRVAVGENASDLDYADTGALSGSFVDAAGNLADVTLRQPGAPGSLSASSAVVIDTVAPYVMNITADKAAGSYPAGTVVNITVLLNESVSVTGVPMLKLNVGANRSADYVGTNGSAMTFRYTALAGDSASILDGVLSATVSDAAGNVATLAKPSLGLLQAITIDTVAPFVQAISPVSASGTYGPGSTIQFSLTMSERVSVAPGTTPSVRLNTVPAKSATMTSQSPDGRVLYFDYPPSIGDVAPVLNHASVGALTATLSDAAGNPAVLTLPAPVSGKSLGGNGVITVDAVIKVISSTPALSTTPPGPLYGSPLTQIDLTFNAPVENVSMRGIGLFFEGRSVSLTGATITQLGNSTTYRLTLPRAVTNLNGSYRLRIGGGASGITSGGVVMNPATNLYWRKA